jgi:hypothetical protein
LVTALAQEGAAQRQRRSGRQPYRLGSIGPQSVEQQFQVSVRHLVTGVARHGTGEASRQALQHYLVVGERHVLAERPRNAGAIDHVLELPPCAHRGRDDLLATGGR